MPLTDGQTDGEDEEEGEGEEGRKLRTALAFMCEVGRKGMPRDVFQVVMGLLMGPPKAQEYWHGAAGAAGLIERREGSSKAISGKIGNRVTRMNQTYGKAKQTMLYLQHIVLLKMCLLLLLHLLGLLRKEVGRLSVRRPFTLAISFSKLHAQRL